MKKPGLFLIITTAALGTLITAAYPVTLILASCDIIGLEYFSIGSPFYGISVLGVGIINLSALLAALRYKEKLKVGFNIIKIISIIYMAMAVFLELVILVQHLFIT